MANWTYKITYTTRTGFAVSAEKTAEIVAPTSRQAFEALEAQHPGEKIRIIAADSRRALALHVIDHQDAQTARITCATFTSADVARRATARDYPTHEITKMREFDLVKTNILDLAVGDHVFAHSAVFEIYRVTIRPERDPVYGDGRGIMVAMGRWLYGDIVPGYFGPGRDWNFQGNSNVDHYVITKG